MYIVVSFSALIMLGGVSDLCNPASVIRTGSGSTKGKFGKGLVLDKYRFV